MHVDNEMRKLGIHISYKFWFRVCCLYVSNLLLIPFMIYITNRPWITKLSDVICIYYSVMIRCGYFSYPIISMFVLHERLKQLNKRLNELDDDEDDCSFVKNEMKKKLLNELSPFFILDKATEIHASLVEISIEIKNLFSLIFLSNIVTNIVQATQAMIIIYSGDYKEIFGIEMAILFIINNAEVLALVLISYFVESEVCISHCH